MSEQSNAAGKQLLDRYVEEGRVYMTGTQALVRLPLLQLQMDRAGGLNTSCYISGYRGSPLGNFDLELLRAQALITERGIVFQPGVNEDLAATALWGTQQVGLRDRSDCDGVFGLWYGKGPGVDRTGDAFRHANLAGTSANGGVVALLGDDHTCESSTTCHQSEYAMVDAMMPTLNPCGVQEIVEFGLHGWAMSRYSGCWVGLKCVHDTVSATTSVEVPPSRFNARVPDDFDPPADGLNIRAGDTPREQEARLHDYKLRAAQAYCRANRLDRITLDSSVPRIGIVTTGKSSLDVKQALLDLRIGKAEAEVLGLRICKIGLVWPLEPTTARAFCEGLDIVLVVEEKRGLMEEQLKNVFYGWKDAPAIVGKTDRHGRPLLRSILDLDSNMAAIAIAETILATLGDVGPSNVGDESENELDRAKAPRADIVRGRLLDGIGARLDRLKRLSGRPRSNAPLTRRPYFCAGCPHNTSTRMPEGSRGMAGIGCAWMAQFMDRNVDGYSQMGGEGATWVGEAPFSNTRHIFQNLGDGTYFHSGVLAIRAAVAADVNITFKILYNDAVAMTGGQPHDGPLSPWGISWQVHGEGVRAIALVTDEPEKYAADVKWAPGVTLHHRRELDEVQRRFREISGVTAIIYDQTCAAEKRRRRKRNLYPDPAKRLFINSEVCEGCGDCGIASNCTALLPKDTALGRKRAIDQSACNKDYSCVDGFCPSFVTVLGGELRKPEANVLPSDAPPQPNRGPLDDAYNVVITGVGGTGVVTLGALLGMAAHIEGKGFAVLDMTGLAQKGGAVISHLRLAPRPEDIGAVRIASGGADLVLGCDSLVTAGPETLDTMRFGATRVLVNSREVMPGEFTRDADLAFPAEKIVRLITERVGQTHVESVASTDYAAEHLNDSIGGNLVMLGYAFQKGLIPLSASAIDSAIEINGVAVAMNRQAFLLGRRMAAGMIDEACARADSGTPTGPDELDALISHRRGLLVRYQDASYADRYRTLVDKVRGKEAELGSGRRALSAAVAKQYFRLLAYKDEYEVARMYSDPEFAKDLRTTFSGNYRLKLNLAPPLIARRDRSTGYPVKREFGPWIFKAFLLLAPLKRLRGTPFDIFGYGRERKLERGLILEYERLLTEELLPGLSPDNYETAVALAELPENVRGFGHVKHASVERMRRQRDEQLARFHAEGPVAVTELA